MTENPTHAGQIPVVDFGAFSVAHEEFPAPTDPAAQDLVKRLYSACSTTGFVYLLNHGISQDEVDNAFQTVSEFFSLESEVKRKWKMDNRNMGGWGEFQLQKASVESYPDLKEFFDVKQSKLKESMFPGDDVIPGFKSTIETFSNHLHQLSMRVLTALATALDVSPELFISAHETSDSTILRFNHYPKIDKGVDVKIGQLRCGEHTDFGSITLVVQDDNDGFQVQTGEGKCFPIPPIPGTIVLGFGNLMQRWTSDRLKAAVHRVVVPEEVSKREKGRLSAIFFVLPDSTTMVSCLDGSNKYPPVNAGDYIEELFMKTLEY